MLTNDRPRPCGGFSFEQGGDLLPTDLHKERDPSMSSPLMIEASSSPRFSWWNPNALQKEDPLDRMLLDFAFRNGETVRSATFHAILIDDSKKGREEFLAEFCTVMVADTLVEKEALEVGSIERWLVWGEGWSIIQIDEHHKVTLDIATLSKEAMKSAQDLIGKLAYGVAGRQPIYALAHDKGDVIAAEVGVVKHELERGNYNESVLDDLDFIVQELNKDDPAGRLVIFEGDPGTGKSYLVRAIMESILDSVFLLVPPQMIGDLASPSLISTLIRVRKQMGTTKPIIIVIEDADHCLRSRQQDATGELEVGPITSLLNLSDGLLGHALNLRVICTTNVPQGDIDPALNRPRRLLAHVHVGNLDPERATAVYERLTEDDTREFKFDLALADVYHYAANPHLLDIEEEETNEEEGAETEEEEEDGTEEESEEEEGSEAEEETEG